MLKPVLAALLLCASTAVSLSAFAGSISSQSALVIEEETGKILLEKNPTRISSIASLTKLMTAMVVLDAQQDMNERVVIEQDDVDMLKHSSSRLPVGAAMSRGEMLQVALMSSDNRAAHALGRTYPGGKDAFLTAVREKIAALGMNDTVIEEPTGLSPRNQSTAADLAKMAMAAGTYAEIARITTDVADRVQVNNRLVGFHNTNHFVGQKGYEILLSKTGYTLEAGRCLIMRMKAAGKNVVMVLLNATAGGRNFDVVQVQRLLTGAPVVQAQANTRRVSYRAPAKRARTQQTRT